MDDATLKWFIHTVMEMAEFIKANYEPWQDWLVDDIAMYILPSVKAGTIIDIPVGGELQAIYEYWPITPKYLKMVRSVRGNDDWVNYLPSEGDRDGDGAIIFFPLAVIAKDWRDETGPSTKLCIKKIRKLYPNLRGHYRWVLKEERVKFVPYRRINNPSMVGKEE